MFGIGIWLAANAFEVVDDDGDGFDHFRPVCVGVVPHWTIAYIFSGLCAD